MRTHQENDIQIITLEGDLQGAQVDELNHAFNGLIENNTTKVALDMSQVGYIYSNGVGSLVHAQKKLKEKNGELFLFNLSNPVRKILMEINLLDFLNGYATKAEMEFDFFKGDPSESEASFELGLSMECSHSTEDTATFELMGTIDTPSDLECLINECASKIAEGCVHLHFDLTDLIYIDDKGVLEWKSIEKGLKEKSGSLTLKAMNEIVRDQLKIMGMQSQFKIN